MKRFIVISLAFIAMAVPSWGCGGEYSMHNKYLFSVFRREMMKQSPFTKEFDKFWAEYTNGECKHYEWNSDKIMEIAKSKNDQEMVTYLQSLNAYLDAARNLDSEWDYPSKEELQKRKDTATQLLQKVKAYKGTRLSAQWALLRMRANMFLGNHDDNISFWEQTASKMPESSYRDLMRNIYAGSILRKGDRIKACDIYAEQGDMVSIKWVMRKYRNLAGIQRIYEENPNSPTMSFLIQDFVNNTQETMDSYRSEEDTDWMNMIDAKVILRNEVDRFISYAQKVVSEKKTKSPALWQAAIGELQYLCGNYSDAVKTLDKAVKMDGTQRMRDNARAIRTVASVHDATLDKKYSQWMTGEIKWLVEKIKEEANDATYNTEEDNWYYYYNHYYDVLDRLVFSNLAPKYKAAGREDMALALIASLDQEAILGISKPSYNEDTEYSWNDRYSSEFFNELDSLTAAQTLKFYQFLSSNDGDALEKYIKNTVKSDADYYNDIIGTKYLAEGNFKEAVQYLEKVPLRFLEGQNISYYLGHRQYNVAKWLVNQRESEDLSEGPNKSKLRTNPKIDFCKEMSQLLSRYAVANAQTRPQLAYDLATRYYQASYLGDCWWLTQYGSSVIDTARVNRPDFVQIAIDYLQESKKSTNLTLCENSLYALAFIPTDAWCELDYDWSTGKEKLLLHRGSRQYKALMELNSFVRNTNAEELSAYTRKCDVLRQFRQTI
ncbi:MAG: hypothetical protein J5682_08925 [Prevotella sp.]|nr:hypothetical protein [Prevotella sp.]